MIPVAEARRFVLSACRPLPIGPVHMRDALGHVLAEVLRAPEAVPRFANSAMDGYALRAVDTHPAPARLRVLGSVMAGDHSKVLVSAGDAIRIMTGAPVPPGADAVCMIERTRVEEHGAIVVVEEAVHPGTNVRRAGEDVLMGAELFGPGTRVGPAHLGVLSSLGIESVLAYRRPTVGVLSTGDELLTTAGTPGPGKIRDANRPALLAQIQTDGFQTVDLGIARDDEGLLAEILEDGASRCDAIVASGGVSVGDRDAMKAVLEKMGGSTVRSMQVAVKPAKPFAFARLDGTGTPVFGLPGNPVSALVSYELFVRPALGLLAGRTVLDRPRLSAIAEDDIARRRDGKLHLLRVAVRSGADGMLRARLSGGQDSHMLRAMAGANGLALLHDGEGIRGGDRLEVMLLDDDALAGSAAGPW